jgi:hypothetical protein
MTYVPKVCTWAQGLLGSGYLSLEVQVHFQGRVGCSLLMKLGPETVRHLQQYGPRVGVMAMTVTLEQATALALPKGWTWGAGYSCNLGTRANSAQTTCAPRDDPLHSGDWTLGWWAKCNCSKHWNGRVQCLGLVEAEWWLHSLVIVVSHQLRLIQFQRSREGQYLSLADAASLGHGIPCQLSLDASLCTCQGTNFLGSDVPLQLRHKKCDCSWWPKNCFPWKTAWVLLQLRPLREEGTTTAGMMPW